VICGVDGEYVTWSVVGRQIFDRCDRYHGQDRERPYRHAGRGHPPPLEPLGCGTHIGIHRTNSHEEAKHHKGVVFASNDVSPREHEGWCLPASSDILELRHQQSLLRKRAERVSSEACQDPEGPGPLTRGGTAAACQLRWLSACESKIHRDTVACCDGTIHRHGWTYTPRAARWR
jgi:hypothetical protein